MRSIKESNSLQNMILTKNNNNTKIMHTSNQLIEFVAINVSEKDENLTKWAITEAIELCKRGELSDIVWIENNAFFVLRMTKKRVWSSIQLHLDLGDIKSEFVFLITKI